MHETNVDTDLNQVEIIYADMEMEVVPEGMVFVYNGKDEIDNYVQTVSIPALQAENRTLLSESQETLESYVENRKNAFNQHATVKTGEFDTHVLEKQDEFDSYADAKKALVDTQVDAAEQAADEASDSAEQAASSASAAAQSAQIAQDGVSFPIGTIFFSLRTDAPAGTVVCDGAEWTGEAFPQFYNDFLLTGKVPSVSYDEYASLLAANGSVGVCALDTVNGKFKVPKLTDVFIRTTLLSANAGDFQADALQNITGTFGPYSTFSMNSENDEGAFGTTALSIGLHGIGSGSNSEVWAYKTFDASKVVRTADETRPKYICYRAFLQVYTAAAEASQAEVSFFIEQVQQINTQIGLINTALEERLNGY